MYLSKTQLVSFLARWRPQVAAGQLISVTGVHEYTRARIKLADSDRGGGLLAPESHLFIVNTRPMNTEIKACLWVGDPSYDHRRRALCSLREWHAEQFPDVCLTYDSSSESRELSIWRDLD